ncbi:MAG: ATP-binding protein [Candidatus Micrarchaeota archaeon]|nr:ATP-binding protein [Candidatus Micrarchaeota archaeon]
MNIETLAKQNPWWADKNAINQDPKIVELERAHIKWKPRLLKYIDLSADAFYSVRGPRQVGKTTLMKMMIREELKARKPENIFYYACDMVNSAAELVSMIDTYLDWSERISTDRKLIILDEISRVKEWEVAYKGVVDRRSLTNKTFIFTGSSCWDLKHAPERLGGRKGETYRGQSHKILMPMKFSEYAALRSEGLKQRLDELGITDSAKRKIAFNSLFSTGANRVLDPILPLKGEADALFDEYLLTGGVMSALNQYVTRQKIDSHVYENYLQLFFGDLARLNRSETTAKKVLLSVLNHRGGPVGWARLAKESGIPTAVTVMDYTEALQTLFILNVYDSYDESKNRPKHRSEKKIQLPNPFFFHAFRSYLENPAGDYFKSSQEWLSSSENKALAVEQTVGDHLSRLCYNLAPSDLFDQAGSVFYTRNAKGETIDFLARLPDGLLPVEVKYQNTIQGQDFRNIQKHPRGILATKNHLQIGGAHPAIPVSLLLLFI